MTVFGSLVFIYITAIFFWFRYFYRHSLKTKEYRVNLLESTQKIFLFIPPGIQAILLLYFAVIQAIPLSNKLAAFFEFIFYTNLNGELPDFEAARIIFIQSLLLSVQHLLLKADIPSLVINLLYKLVVFIASIFFLRLLIENVFHSLSFSFMSSTTINYNNNFLWLFSAVVFLVVGIIRSPVENRAKMNFTRYVRLASGIVFLYSLFVIIIAIPQILFIVIEHLQ